MAVVGMPLAAAEKLALAATPTASTFQRWASLSAGAVTGTGMAWQLVRMAGREKWLTLTVLRSTIVLNIR